MYSEYEDVEDQLFDCCGVETRVSSHSCFKTRLTDRTSQALRGAPRQFLPIQRVHTRFFPAPAACSTQESLPFLAQSSGSSKESRSPGTTKQRTSYSQQKIQNHPGENCRTGDHGLRRVRRKEALDIRRIGRGHILGVVSPQGQRVSDRI